MSLQNSTCVSVIVEEATDIETCEWSDFKLPKIEAGRVQTLETKREQRKIGTYFILERCQLHLRRLRTFLCVEDRVIGTSSHSPTNLSSLWFKIRRVNGLVHHHHQWTWTPQLATLSTPCCTAIRFGYKIIGNWRRLRYDKDDDLDLDLDSARIQLDRLDHTLTPSMSVKSCHFWGENRACSSFVDLCWLYSSSSLLVNLVLSCILPVQRLLWSIASHVHVQTNEVVFLSVCCPRSVVPSHTSALYRRVGRIIASYNLVFGD